MKYFEAIIYKNLKLIIDNVLFILWSRKVMFKFGTL